MTLLLTSLLPGISRVRAAEYRFTKVALRGEDAPGTAAGTTFASFSTPSLGASGHVLFNAFLTGPGITTANDFGTWLGRAGTVGLVMRESDPVAGMQPGVTYAHYAQSSLPASGTVNAVGLTAFSTLIAGPDIDSSNNGTVWTGSPGSLQLLARSGEQAPSTAAGVYFTGFNVAAFNAAGQAVLGAGLRGNGIGRDNNRGLWTATPGGGLAKLARTGDPAVSAPPGSVHDWYLGLLGPITLNAAGQSTFYGRAGGGGTWLGAPGSVILLAYDGYPAPDTGANFSGSIVGSRAPINAAGQSVFSFSLSGAGVTTENDNGIWLGLPGQLQLLARKGNPAPGTPAGVTYAALNGNPPVINALGQVAFHGKVGGTGVSGGNDWGIWRGSHGNVAKLVREADAAPGLNGPAFGDTSLATLAINDRAEVVFSNVLTGSGAGITSSNDGSLWIADAVGKLSLVIREGDALEVAPGVHRVISALTFLGGSGDEDGQPCSFNDRGEVAFLAAFTDGSSGIFIAAPAFQIASAVSRKVHGSAGTFDIALPLTGEAGVECRASSGNHTLVIAFTNDVASGNVAVISGKGSAGTPALSGNTITVALTEVTDMQSVTVELSELTDQLGQDLPDTTIRIKLLAGDTNGSKTVNATDIGQTKAQSGITVTEGNFRQDMVPSGTINSSDIGLVKSRAGATVP